MVGWRDVGGQALRATTTFLVMSSVGLALNKSWIHAIAYGLIFTAAMGVVAHLSGRRERARAVQAGGALDAGRRRTAISASRGGPVPADPEIRAEAARLVDRRLKRDGATDVYAVLLGIAALFLAVVGMVSSHWWWGSAIGFAAMAGTAAYGTRSGAARLARLREGGNSPPDTYHSPSGAAVGTAE